MYSDCSVYRILKERWCLVEPPARGDFYVMDAGDWAVCIALTPAKKCVMVKQFRFGSQDFSWELPAGVVDQGESPVQGALRELYEESGYTGDTARTLGIVHPNPAIQRNRCHVILLEDAYLTGKGAPDPHEFFEVREVPLAQLFAWAKSGVVTHAIVHCALFLFQNSMDDLFPLTDC